MTLERAQSRIWCSKIGWQTVPCSWSIDGAAALSNSSPGTRDQQSPRRRGCCVSQCSMHYPVKFDADIFIQSGVIDIFLSTYPKHPKNPRLRRPPSWIFRLCEFAHSGVLTVWYLCSIPNVVPISVIVTEIDALMLLSFIR